MFRIYNVFYFRLPVSFSKQLSLSVLRKIFRLSEDRHPPAQGNQAVVLGRVGAASLDTWQSFEGDHLLVSYVALKPWIPGSCRLRLTDPYFKYSQDHLIDQRISFPRRECSRQACQAGRKVACSVCARVLRPSTLEYQGVVCIQTMRLFRTHPGC